MKYHIDRRICLSDDPEFKPLYSWSLQEIDKEGAKIGRDQIPWGMHLYFTATELSYSDGLTIKPAYGNNDEDPPIVTTKRRNIYAKLRPGTPSDAPPGIPSDRLFRTPHPSYSMFGTDRTVTDFELFIEALADGEEQDRCTVSGNVRSTMEIGFRDQTLDDVVAFYLYVRPETFEHYVRMVRAAEVEAAVLHLRA